MASARGSPRIKEEENDALFTPSHPAAPSMRPADAQLSQGVRGMEQRGTNGPFSRPLPSQATPIQVKEEEKEPGELDSSPAASPFPRALQEPAVARNRPTPSTRSGGSRVLDRLIRTGPVPEQGTPQDRFMQAMMNLNLGQTSSNAGPRDQAPAAADGRRRNSIATRANALPVQAPRRPLSRQNGSSGFGRADPEPDNPILRLSLECQKRHFNPHFEMDVTPNGKYTCTVKLLDAMIVSDGTYHTVRDAKIAVALKALRNITTWGPAPGFNGFASLRRRNSPRDPPANNNNNNNNNNSQTGPAIKEEDGDVTMRDIDPVGTSTSSHNNAATRTNAAAAAAAAAVAAASGPRRPRSRSSISISTTTHRGGRGGGDRYRPPARRTSSATTTTTMMMRTAPRPVEREHAFAGTPDGHGVRVREAAGVGLGIALPDAARENADVTRAFLEGLAAGARLAGAASRAPREWERTRGRSRSQSPSPAWASFSSSSSSSFWRRGGGGSAYREREGLTRRRD